MLAGVAEPSPLLGQDPPGEIIAVQALGDGRNFGVQVDEQIGPRKALPHIGNVGVFLGAGAGI